MSTILEEIREQASQRSYDLNKLSERTGISTKTAQQILSGKSNNPTLETLDALAEYFSGKIIFRTGGEDYASINGDVSYFRRLLCEKKDEMDRLYAEKNKEIETKDKWIIRLFIVSLLLIVSNISTAIILGFR